MGRRRLAPSAWDADRLRSSRWVGSRSPPPLVARPPRTTTAAGTRRQEVSGLHGDRHRRHRRQVVQRLGLDGPAGRQGQANDNIDIKYVASKAEADYEPNLTQLRQPEVRLHPRGRWPDGRRHQEDRQGEPEPAVRHRRRQAGLANVYPMQFDTAQAGFLAGYLAAGHDQDRQGRHLRRPQDPAGDRSSWTASPTAWRTTTQPRARTSRCSAGTRPSRTAPSPTTSPSRTRARVCRHAGRPGRRHHHAGRRRHRPRHRRRGQGVQRQVHVIWVDQSTAARAPPVLRGVPDHRGQEHPGRGQGRPCSRPPPASSLPADPGLRRHAGQQRCLARPVPRLRQQGPGRRSRPRSTSSRRTSSPARSRSPRRPSRPSDTGRPPPVRSSAASAGDQVRRPAVRRRG